MSIRMRSFFKDTEVVFILLFNVITLFSYYFGELDSIYVLWAYYLQSLQIGARYWFLEVFNQFRSTKKQWFFTWFFPIHFGGFHLAYFVFLIISSGGANFVMLKNFLIINIIILAGQFVIFIYREVSSSAPYHKQASFFAPYARVFPMHIIIILGINASKFGINVFYIFIFLKTIVDLISYRWLEQKEVINN